MIGLGGIGQRHLRNLRAQLGSQVEILAYRVRRESNVLTDKLQIEPGSSLEEKYDVAVFNDLNAALAQKPDVAFICNPSSMHLSVALAAAEAGCHLLIEKPVSHNLDDLDKLIETVERKQLVALVAYQMRFHPCLKRVHSLLAQNAIGSVLAVRAEVGEYLPGWHLYEDYRQMYASRREQGGGVILSQIHEMDYLYWMFGFPRKIFALGGHLSRLEIDVEDVASILMDFNGIPVHLHQDYIQRPPSRTLQIIGDQGKIIADFRTLTVEHFNENGELQKRDSFEGFNRNQMFMEELAHFFACIEGRETPIVLLRDGAQSLRMALAAKESLETGKIVEF